MGLSDLVYSIYGRRIQRNLDPQRIPRHVAVMLDGNRRWARAFGAPTASGHRAGAEKAQEFLGWCDEVHVKVVTLFLLSTDNLHRPDDVRSLLQEHAGRGTSIEELAEVLDVEHIADDRYTKGQPDPDLVIRASGEQRL